MNAAAILPLVLFAVGFSLFLLINRRRITRDRRKRKARDDFFRKYPN
ncbi:hypothetical protein Barb6XT_03202 [Bacteroidales bacterium Barb6XT]|nr:hypothetical protein Barb6XT_03202 [Bacteroidales bacterium Barb6XT]